MNAKQLFDYCKPYPRILKKYSICGIEDLKTVRKGAGWKVVPALHLRKQHLVPHNWLADNISMGQPSSVQSWLSHTREDMEVLKWLQKLEKHGNVG